MHVAVELHAALQLQPHPSLVLLRCPCHQTVCLFLHLQCPLVETDCVVVCRCDFQSDRCRQHLLSVHLYGSGQSIRADAHLLLCCLDDVFLQPHCLIGCYGKTVLGDGGVQPAQPCQPPQLAVALVGQHLVLHVDQHVHRLLLHILCRHRHFALIIAWRSILRNLYAAPQGLHIPFGNSHIEEERCTVPIRSLLVEAGHRCAWNDFSALLVLQVREGNLDILQASVCSPKANLPYEIFVAQGCAFV